MDFKTYEEVIKFDTFEERYEYLKLQGTVGEETFGYTRHLNQNLYTSRKWKNTRRNVLIRDNGCDMGLTGYDIFFKAVVHHINPLTPSQIENDEDCIYDMNNLICVSDATHKAIHFGSDKMLSYADTYIERGPNDTSPWRK